MDKRFGSKAVIVLLLTAIVLAIVLSVSGCTSPSSNTTQTSTIVSLTTSDPPSLDPNLEYDTATSGITQNVYETLTFYDGRGTDKTVGLLATNWSHNDNFTVWTFDLRHGVTFQDGTAFNASAVKYTFDRGVLVNYASGPWAAVLTPFLQGGSTWLNSNLTQADADAYLANDPVQVIDDYTVQITLANPYPDFDKIMAFAGTAIVSPSFDQAHGGYKINDYGNTTALKEAMCGTGPYEFGSWTHNDRIVLNKNPNYWGTPANESTVVIRNVPDLTTRLQLIDSGQADISVGENAKNIPQISNMSNNTVLFVNNDSMSIDFFGFFEGKAPFNNSSVRQAFIEAFDVNTYKDTVMYGYGAIPHGCIPQLIVGYNTNIPTSPYNITDSKAILQSYLSDNGYTASNPLTVNLVYNTGNTRREAATVMMADSINNMSLPITVKVQDIAWATFLDQERAGAIDMFAIGWLADYPGADDFLGPFAVGPVHEYADNVAYNNSTINALYTQYFKATSDADRQAIVDNIQMGMINDSVYNFYYQPPNVFMYNKNLKGFEESWNVLDSGARYAPLYK